MKCFLIISLLNFQPPVFENVTSIDVLEGATDVSTVATFNVTDPDGGDVMSCWLNDSDFYVTREQLNGAGRFSVTSLNYLYRPVLSTNRNSRVMRLFQNLTFPHAYFFLDFGIRVDSGTILDYDVMSSYEINVTCIDDENETASVSVQVRDTIL
ncbi:hypothetical protein DPMN_181683 [Dreissena polymorpha]|uniref:Uncharacterized protein n=1 Tax=Dreissena polymorpha TaxID=45954 RepID=A0A9D4DEY8_DREPO|nr:hypothetical protein DPMN_181683 [Dreissena polymorpha]